MTRGAPARCDEPDDKAVSAFGAEQFRRAVELAPDRYAGLSGIDGPEIAISSAWRDRSGTPGSSQVMGLSTVLTGAWGSSAGTYALRLDWLALQSGSAVTDEDNGENGFSPTTTLHAVEPTLSWRREDDHAPHVEIGLTPVGGVLPPTVQGRAGAHFGDPLLLSGEIYRATVTDSILSMTGVMDAATGQRFGRVTESGGSVGAEYSFGDHWDANAAASWGLRQGVRVQDNAHAAGTVSVTYDLHPPGFESFNIGPTYGYDHFDHDLSGFELGSGGYYSPQSLHRVGLDIDFKTIEAKNFIIHIELTPSWYREQGAGAAASYGVSVSGVAEAVYLLGDHWSLGGEFHRDASSGYRDVYGGLALKFSFEPRRVVVSSDLPAPPFR